VRQVARGERQGTLRDLLGWLQALERLVRVRLRRPDAGPRD
jgi:DNA-binding TFAR19-related protein (PDSD5 family)